MADYPNIDCGKHGEARPGYIVCPHYGRRLLEFATSRAAGLVLCDACNQAFVVGPESRGLFPVCEECQGREVQPNGRA